MVRLVDVNEGINFWRISMWEKGSTEPGSSGSPLFNSNGSIIGHLFGGDSSCTKLTLPDYYGSLSRDWVLPSNPIRPYLDPVGTNEMRLSGAPLKDLRTQNSPQPQPAPVISSDSMVTSTATISVTQTITKHSTITSTVIIAKTTNVVVSRSTITVVGERTITTKEVTKTVTAVPVTVTSTFTRIPPPIVSVRTVTVTK